MIKKMKHLFFADWYFCNKTSHIFRAMMLQAFCSVVRQHLPTSSMLWNWFAYN